MSVRVNNDEIVRSKLLTTKIKNRSVRMAGWGGVVVAWDGLWKHWWGEVDFDGGIGLETLYD